MASWVFAAKQIVFSWQKSHKQQAARNCLFYTYKFSCVSAILMPNLVQSPKPLSLQRKLPETLLGSGVDPLLRLQGHQNEFPPVLLRSVQKITLVQLAKDFYTFSSPFPWQRFLFSKGHLVSMQHTKKTYCLPFRNLKNITIK